MLTAAAAERTLPSDERIGDLTVTAALKLCCSGGLRGQATEGTQRPAFNFLVDTLALMGYLASSSEFSPCAQ